MSLQTVTSIIVIVHGKAYAPAVIPSALCSVTFVVSVDAAFAKLESFAVFEPLAKLWPFATLWSLSVLLPLLRL